MAQNMDLQFKCNTKATFADYFTIERQLGSGAFGSVFIAKPLAKASELIANPPPLVAVKRAASRQALEKDIVALKMLDNEHIIKYYGCWFTVDDTSKATMSMVMEYADDMKDMVDNLMINNTIVAGLVDGLQYMHSKGVYHRDIKPENILVSNDGQRVKYIDLGMFCVLDSPYSDYTCDTNGGTINYKDWFLVERFPATSQFFYYVPEALQRQVVRQKTMDKAVMLSDWYSLAVVIYTVNYFYTEPNPSTYFPIPHHPLVFYMTMMIDQLRECLNYDDELFRTFRQSYDKEYFYMRENDYDFRTIAKMMYRMTKRSSHEGLICFESKLRNFFPQIPRGTLPKPYSKLIKKLTVEFARSGPIIDKLEEHKDFYRQQQRQRQKQKQKKVAIKRPATQQKQQQQSRLKKGLR